MKLVLFLVLLIITLPLISESFSYFDADMINQNLENKNYNYQESKSEIIQFNEYYYKVEKGNNEKAEKDFS